MPAAQRAPVVSIILCVDDEVTPLTIRKCVLQKAGFHVITAGSAKDALEILRTTNVDLVVSDHLRVTRSVRIRTVDVMSPPRPEGMELAAPDAAAVRPPSRPDLTSGL